MLKEFSWQTRNSLLRDFKQNDQEYDLVIVGGGITGAGVARDAAQRGMKVALFEGQDFAIGTSSRSSKLIHGGIRYLENLEFHLVFEALSERRHLFEMAPHLVHPLRFMLPLYQGDRVGSFKMSLGMWLYDILSLFEAPKMHEALNSQQSLGRIPSLRAKELKGSFVYSDAYMDDDRLVLETLRSAHHSGAHCVNFVKVEKPHFEPHCESHFKHGKVIAVDCKDTITNDVFKIKAKHFISTVGPWTDELGSTFFDHWKNKMRPSKGVHFTLAKERFRLPSAVVMAGRNDKRIVFAIPRHEMVIIGTTDTDYSGSPYDVKATQEDIRYLLEITNHYFPGAQITDQDILATYAGVRPLVHDGSRTESKTSRKHMIYTDPYNMTFVAGGKYTTYRKISEEVVERVLSFFSIKDQVKYNQAHTKDPLNPLATVESLAECHRTKHRWPGTLSTSELDLLIDRHGQEALFLLKKYPNKSYWQIEARQALETTMCLRLEDFYWRRSHLFLAEKDHGLSVLDEVSGEFMEFYGWSQRDLDQQKNALQQKIRKEMSWH